MQDRLTIKGEPTLTDKAPPKLLETAANLATATEQTDALVSDIHSLLFGAVPNNRPEEKGVTRGSSFLGLEMHGALERVLRINRELEAIRERVG